MVAIYSIWLGGNLDLDQYLSIEIEIKHYMLCSLIFVTLHIVFLTLSEI